MDLIPVYDHIVIERVEQPGKIVLITEAAQVGPRYAKVLAVGPGRPSEYSGTMMPPPPCQVGDVILYHGGAGTMVEHQGKKLWFIFPRDVLAVHQRAVPA